ncbi:MAG: DAK2 domain-containing protein [Spiroplasma sp.]|nr:DAK2 domain-containing protein [Spiroplasma sp.]
MKKIDLKILKVMLISGANNLYNHHYEVDKLNVFPVPDGDTGTNMNLTMMNGIKALESKEFKTFKEFGKEFSRGLIMGARGNSGVILSQIFRGFFHEFVHNKDYADMKILKPADILKALIQAKDFAYKAVMKPVEGTILTVIKDGANKVNEECIDEKDPLIVFQTLLKAMQESLTLTPALLPILRKVGVVDSGGAGLVYVIEGMVYGLKHNKPMTVNKKLSPENNKFNFSINNEEEFGYCTELIVKLNQMNNPDFDLGKTRTDLEGMNGQSLVVVEDQNLLKVHIHTLQPGDILNYLQKFGDFLTVKIENMTEQAKAHQPSITGPRKLKNQSALIAFVPGKGIDVFFREQLNVTETIFYSNKVNPSTDDILRTIAKVDAKVVYILPNDSNLLLTAEQAKKLEKKSKVFIIPTVNIAQGMRSALSFNSSLSSKENNRIMSNEIKNVNYGYLSIADRDVEIDDVNIKKDNYITAGTFKNHPKLKILASNKDLNIPLKKLLAKILWNSAEIITIFKGRTATDNEVAELTKMLEDNYDIEYEFVDGQQNVYNFLFVVE